MRRGEWKPNRGVYASGESYYLNRVRVGHYEYDACLPKSGGLSFVGNVFLPSLIKSVNRTATVDEIKAWIEKQVESWLKEIEVKA